MRKIQWTVHCQAWTKYGTVCGHYHNVWVPIGETPDFNWRCYSHKRQRK